MKFSMSWFERQDKRLTKLKRRKHQIAIDFQQSQQQTTTPYQIVRFPSQSLQVQRDTLSVQHEAFKARNRKWRPHNLRPFDSKYEGSFQEAISPVLLIAQIFALMPLRGVTSKVAKDLKFSLFHVRSIYALIILICFASYCCLTIAVVIKGSYSFDGAEGVIFSTSTVLISGAFYALARKWPALMLEWEGTEKKFLTFLQGKETINLGNRIKIIMCIATLCSLIEHILSMSAMFYYIKRCPLYPGLPLETFLHMTSSHLFQFVDFNLFYGLFGKFLNILSTFTWNYNDIFIMSVSVGLSSRFEQLNELMVKAAKRPTSMDFWIKCRVNYRNLCRLCESTDDKISWTILLCFSNNLYFICGKILKSLQKKPSLEHTLYFWFSLGYLLGRTFMLSLYTSNINEEAKRPLIIFRSISREYWCPELKRFSNEVANDDVALSGLKFFRLTRSVVLSVAGTIVTYELVLLQYNKEEKIGDC